MGEARAYHEAGRRKEFWTLRLEPECQREKCLYGQYLKDLPERRGASCRRRAETPAGGTQEKGKRQAAE
jgi:hypothetical protein